MNRSSRRGHRGVKLLLIVGYLIAAVSILITHVSPADGYEVSIYGGTPLLFWIGSLATVGCSMVAVIYSANRDQMMWGLILGGVAIFSVTALPLLRGYYFYGLADSLTHLKWAKWFLFDLRPPWEIIYPGSHLMAVMIGSGTGLPLRRAMMVSVLVFVLLFIVFIPQVVKLVQPNQRAIAIATYSGFMFLPLTNIGTFRMFIPYTLATLFVPFLLYLLLKHVTTESRNRAFPSVQTGAGAFLLLGSGAITFIHPQVAVNVLILFISIAGVQYLYRRYYPNHAISQHRIVYLQVLFLGLFIFVWVAQFGKTYNVLETVLTSIHHMVLGMAPPGQIVQQRNQAAGEAGINLLTLFIKLFLVSAIYTVVAGMVVLTNLFKTGDGYRAERDATITYFMFGGLILGPFFLAHFIGQASHFFFRHIGFAFVIVTLLGALALHEFTVDLPSMPARQFAIGLGMIAIVMSLLTVYPSPYISLPNHHVSEQTLDGYETTFQYQPEVDWHSDQAVWYTSIRRSPERFSEALLVEERDMGPVPRGTNGGTYSGEVSNEILGGNLRSHYRSADSAMVQNNQRATMRRDHYLPVTTVARERAVVVFHELHYTQNSFDSIDTQFGVHRVQSNGEYTLYYVDVSRGDATVRAS